MEKADLLRNYLNDNMVDPNDLKRDAEIYITDIAELFGVEFTDENGWISTNYANQSKLDVSDEVIFDASSHLRYREHQIAYTAGAKWMRNKLTK